ncbi:hypothetical protein FRC07_007239 [Ceratobasidium sp. 392]|nr:hypothetical protein FRC07_007239 [Ceratobasidium sp. 392]
MSEFFKTKQSVTLVLIGSKEEDWRKNNLIVLLHAALSGKTSEDFAYENYSEPAPDDSSRYRIEAKDGLVVNILDTPVLDAEGTQADTITQTVTTLSAVDAFVVVLDESRPELGDGIKLLLSKLSAAFPRPIEKNIVFLFTSPDYNAGSDTLKLNNPPSWVSEEQVIGRPVPDMVGARNQRRPRFRDQEVLFKRLKEPFKWSLVRLKPLWEYIDSSGVQACEMRNLYLRAAGIESQIYQTIAGDSASGDDQATARATTLVNEYQSISTSPDFITHLELVIELLRAEHKGPGMEVSISKLEKGLQALKSESGRYLKWYIVSEAF